MSKVEVVPYNPDWHLEFERLHARVWPVVQHAAMSLEHVGSTSVPGLSAKPIIDACIVVASRRDIPHVVKALTSIGYTHSGDLGVPDRESFRQPAGFFKHHLYASHRGSVSLRNHIGVRDYLRAHPDAVREYGELKLSLAQRFPNDIDNYIAGKTEFLLGILETIGFTEDEVEGVRRINQVDVLARPRVSFGQRDS